MGDSQQDGGKRIGYQHWTKEESKVLLKIMVDATSHGWRTNSGGFSKKIVKDRILPVLNSQLGCNKSYSNFQNRVKWFKKRWLSYSTLLKFSSDIRYDSKTNRFTAPNKVWDEYLKAHPKDGNLRNKVFDDYEDLRTAVGNGVVVGKNSIRLHSATNARIVDAREGMDLVDLDDDIDNEGLVGLEQNDSPPVRSLEVFELPKKQLPNKRSRIEYEGSSNMGENADINGILELLTKMTKTIEGFYGLMKKRGNERTYTTWDAIKEVPNLDDEMRISAFNFLDTRALRDGFLRMTLEERKIWITNTMQK